MTTEEMATRLDEFAQDYGIEAVVTAARGFLSKNRHSPVTFQTGDIGDLFDEDSRFNKECPPENILRSILDECDRALEDRMTEVGWMVLEDAVEDFVDEHESWWDKSGKWIGASEVKK